MTKSFDLVLENRFSKNNNDGIEMESRKEKEKPTKQKRKSISDHLVEFANTTTAHGYAQLANSSKMVKLFWFAVIITFHVLVVFQALPLISKYVSNSTLTRVYIKKVNVQQFPVVVICNNNMFVKQNITNLIKLLQEHGIEGSRESNFTINKHNVYDISNKLKEQLFDFGQSFSDFVFKCKWTALEDDCKNMTSNVTNWEPFWNGYYGACYAFNTGYDKNGIKRNSTLSISHVGPLHALRLTLNIQQKEYFTNLTESAGVRLYIGNQGEYYQPHERGYSLSPGFDYSVALTEERIERINQCNEPLQRKFHMHGQEFVTKYNVEICSYLCLAEILNNECGCITSFLPTTSNNVTFCKQEDDKCMDEEIKEWLTNNQEEEDACSKQCQPSCSEKIFPVQLSSMQFPAKNLLTHYAVVDAQNELVNVVIYFKDFNVKVTEDFLHYELEDLIADIGGILGIYSGYSLLTVIEYGVLIIAISTTVVKTIFMRKK